LNRTCRQTHCVCHYFPFLAALHRRKRKVHTIQRNWPGIAHSRTSLDRPPIFNVQQHPGCG
jgi:hypothetical protein